MTIFVWAYYFIRVSQAVLVVKNPPANAGDTRNVGSIARSGIFLGERNGNLFQYSCLENSMNRGAWWAVVHRLAKSQTCLSAHTHTVSYRMDIG